VNTRWKIATKLQFGWSLHRSDGQGASSKKMKNTTTNIKKGDFIRPAFAPNVFLCIEEIVIDFNTEETSFWTSDEDGGEWEVAIDEIEEIIPGEKVIDNHG
jgi:hypothetical protein